MPLLPFAWRRAMKRRILTIVAAAVIVAGVCMVAYPYVSGALYQHAQDEVSLSQEQAVEDSSSEDVEQAREDAVAYNRDLRMYPASANDPFGPSESGGGSRYDSLLNLAGDGVMGSIDIPSVGISLPVYHGLSDEVLQKGAGHVPGSSLPVGGLGTHAVIAAHTGLPSARMFDALDKVQVGDVFCLHVLGEDLYYRVTDISVRLPDDLGYFTIDSNRDLVTLVTCTPYGLNTHRLLVTGERCDAPADASATDAATEPEVPWAGIALPCALAAGAGVAVAVVLRRRRRHGEGSR